MSGGARTEHFGTSPKIGRKHGRGRAQKSLELIQAMHAIAEASQPITGRGVGYKLFTKGLIPSMSKRDMKPVYRLLKEAREEGIIPWEWIVDDFLQSREIIRNDSDCQRLTVERGEAEAGCRLTLTAVRP
jgi:hypothetical protein